MPELSPLAVILLALGLVVVINGALLLSVARRSSLRQQIRMLRRAAERARDPWDSEEQALEELSRRVSELPPPEADSSHELPDG